MNGTESVNQDVRLFSRKRMELTGIEEVESFTENSIEMRSSLGPLSVEGEGLKIESFSTEKGELLINGTAFGITAVKPMRKGDFFPDS